MSEFHHQPEREPSTPPKRVRKRRMSAAPLIALSIFASAVLISGTVYFTRGGPAAVGSADTPGTEIPNTVNIRPVNKDDHIRGNPSAPIVIVEYSDLECPACNYFHGEMDKLMRDYGVNGQVAWVYRHLPIEQNHKKAWHEAIASECVAELAGNEAFWTFVDLVFENTPGNDGLDLNLLPDLAEQAGAPRSDFEFCLSTERTRPLVEEDYQEAMERSGARGTPHNVIIAAGEQLPLPGAVDYSRLRSYVDMIFQQMIRAQVPPTNNTQ